uniref:Uncharacterized protein n=1 Tax=Nelumbo nucifera TaxID=4432 RepID=A0A822Y1H5_NELNU|nr:TPA_asm: hypothetical protein HUJ06_027785 [Nelumbo nucifera]
MERTERLKVQTRGAVEARVSPSRPDNIPRKPS